VTANRFFLSQAARPESAVWIEGAEHHHLRRVARVRPGETISLFDAAGRQYRALVEKVEATKTHVRILSRQEPVRPARAVVLAPALLKSQAMEFLIQKSTEIALSALVPIKAERSAAKVGTDPSAVLLRWGRIAREAAKQCKTGRVPDIRGPQSLGEFLAEDQSGLKLGLSEGGGAPLKDILMSTAPIGRPGSEAGRSGGTVSQVGLLVGPEGGWSSSEENLFRKAGFRPVSLGDSVLRTETAALCAAFLVKHFLDA